MKNNLNCCTHLKTLIRRFLLCSKTENSETKKETQSMTILHGINFNLSIENSPAKDALNISSISFNETPKAHTHHHDLLMKTSFELSETSLSPGFFKGAMLSFGASPIQSMTDKDSFTDFQLSSRSRTPRPDINIPEFSPSGALPEPMAQNYVRSDTPEVVKTLRKMPKLPPLTPDHFVKTKRKFNSAFKFKMNPIRREEGAMTNRNPSKRMSDMCGGYEQIADGEKKDVPILC